MANAHQYRDLVQAGHDETRQLVRVERFKTKLAPVNTAVGKPEELWIRAEDDPEAYCAIVTMDDPGTLNALSPGMMVQLNATLQGLTRDPKLRVVILTGSDPAFSAGGNLSMIANGAQAVHDSIADPAVPGAGTLEPWRWIRQQFGGVARTIANSNAVFIAAVNGSAAGVGLAFALACDVIIASDKALFVPAFGKLGLVPEVGTSHFLTRKLGYQGAFNFFMQGKSLSGQEALRLGICQQCVEHAKLIEAAKQYAGNVLKMPAHALEMTKTLLRSVIDMDFESSMRMEEFAEANCFSTRALPMSANTIVKKTSSSSKL